MKKNKTLWIIIISVTAGLILGYLFFGNGPEKNSVAEHEHSLNEIYTCSMHPQIRRNEPGACPICGMDLIPVSNLEAGEQDEIRLSESALRLANVQTTLIGNTVPEKEITLNGTVVPNETAIRSQTAHVSGRIEKLFINTTGESVRKGQPLAALYAPDLIIAQKELIQVASRKGQNPGLYEAAKSKLRSFEISEEQIRRIEESGAITENILIHADYSGIVTDKMANLGDHVKAGDVLLTLTDLSSLWVVFEAYESDLPFIHIGDEITFSATSLPGTEFKGNISFIDPVVNSKSRITRVRVEISNQEGRLKPEMFVRGTIRAVSNAKTPGIIVPKTAVLWTGVRSVVYIKTDDKNNAFQLREVELGNDLGEAYVILSGLNTGEKVVTQGAFAIDAAAQLAGKSSMMNMTETPKVLPPAAALENFEPVLEHYIALKDQLVLSDFKSAMSQAGFLQRALDNIPEPSEEQWRQSLLIIRTTLDQMTSAKNIDLLRKQFIDLSSEIVKWARGSGERQSPLYIMYCPMANDNDGAVWVSSSEIVENPYYGEMMLNCGEVTETIQ
ncbi:efflux RND transporter periplasmic adaptor subunit [Fulvivirga sedimenti]|uniref:Efflux RND transporter periplasmic adaptor subunit n=1 Tax=Fulvivirga sedimenti TaxID=2879465 RepID=A0A9X1KWL2_9BACT|nr:efflux RND transporter periplasmic adaptor subunit [Fulvivirga sedimenti]MCA6074074.1 efflux RND transporter periplasmic adaptor subunit [Fulvivirga sedimenti]